MFNRDKANQLLALKQEVANDPEGLGYAAVVEVTSELLALLNTPESNPQVADQVPVPFDEFAMVDAVDEITNADYDALNGRKKAVVDAIINAAMANPELTFGHAKKPFRNAFGVSSTTWLNVKDDRMRQASRAESLFGRDTVISREDWFAARDS